MTDREIVFLGYGYTARALARRLKTARWRIAATARSAEKAAAIERAGARAIPWTGSGIDPAAFAGACAVLVSTPPGEGGCPALAAAGEALAARAGDIAWIGYLSSNGVYGDHGGAWVDEFSPLRAASRRGLRRIAAEADWAALGATWNLPVAIFRLPGIYGPGRSALDAVREGRARRIVKEGQVFNRMHVDDIAAALEASLARPEAGALFNLADDEPSPPQDVIEYACALLGVDPPPPVPFEEAELSEMGRSFYLENKRVRNDRMKQALGLKLAFPTYREGLRAILAAGG
ncbi:SDR family oxidoreductase [Amphiplicatus metriothermophilus]|uniref:Nucleoside-diphosphate-sugar epimerase n=1 Tax=Amphiplicatus metriothermophilus TaxID=1519374 RepID=A0A239PIJ6_9PROT|nr:SDR family oxidoreductase [Amphiplicatus metriothermophilus]MBB5518034.1 nucleoside-diphosphate-sugar epimerase [Amphiplicatus metriothermophilus]SNT67632.1 Nucleoside-diphosphate-sugar epimerase [Amphiplicatus metriothermophilus]